MRLDKFLKVSRLIRRRTVANEALKEEPWQMKHVMQEESL